MLQALRGGVDRNTAKSNTSDDLNAVLRHLMAVEAVTLPTVAAHKRCEAVVGSVVMANGSSLRDELHDPGVGPGHRAIAGI